MSLVDKPYIQGRTFVFSIEKGEDLLPFLQQFCIENQIKFATISGIGAVYKATFAIYDQKSKRYNKIQIEKELEILSIIGNVSIYDYKPVIHAHITLSDQEGKAFGGHLMSPTILFSSEIIIQELSTSQGSQIKTRKLDKMTQLLLWQSPLKTK